MPVTIKSYYKTTEIDEGTLSRAIGSAKDQENKILKLYKQFGLMTMWDVYDTYNILVGPIIPSSVGRSLDTLKKLGVIEGVGTIPGEQGRPVTLYQLVNEAPDEVSRSSVNKVPTAIKIDLHFTPEGDFDVEKMVEELDLKLSKISRIFNINY
jgi:hypothetical protein